VEIADLFHVNFTDLPYWLPPSAQVGLAGPIGGRRGFAIINAYTVAFFDQALHGRALPLLDEAARLFPRGDRGHPSALARALTDRCLSHAGTRAARHLVSFPAIFRRCGPRVPRLRVPRSCSRCVKDGFHDSSPRLHGYRRGPDL
jgi:hypothetical protein